MNDSPPISLLGRTRGFIAARKQAIRIVIIDGLILAALLAGAELLIRTLDPRYTRHLFDAEFTGSMPIDMNADGYRGPLVPTERADDEIRILALGDSVTFGSGVLWNETWPERLGERIAQATGRPVSVINTAVPGTDLDQMRVALPNLHAKHDPDVVVLLLTGNVISLGWIRQNDDESPPFNGFLDYEPPTGRAAQVRLRIKRGIKDFALPSFASLNMQRAMYWLGLLRHDVTPDDPAGVLLAHGWIQGSLDPNRTEEAWAELESDLQKLKTTSDQLALPLFVSYAPPRFSLTDSLVDNEKAIRKNRLTIDAPQRAIDLLQQLQVRTIDIRPALHDARTSADGFAPLYSQFDYTHFDATGHDAVAGAFVQPLLGVLGP